MRSKLWLHATLSIVLLFSLAICAHAGMFSDYSFEKAKEMAQSQHKYFLIDFTATWCGPCKKMEMTTFADAKVRDWIRDNAIAIQVDVDEHRSIAMSLNISAMPTVVIFAPTDFNKEFDREVGYKNTDDFLDWLNSVKAGKTGQPSLEDKVAAVTGKGGPKEVETRYKFARYLLASNQLPAATDQYVWLWQNIPTQDPPLMRIRDSYIVAGMRTLLRNYPDAKQVIGKLRDESDTADMRRDWIQLNDMLGDQDKTLAWFDAVKKQPDQQKDFDQVDYMLQALLIKNNRWADMGTYLYKEPLQKISKLEAFATSVKDYYRRRTANEPGVSQSAKYDPFPENASIVYASMLAAGRDKDADAVVKECLQFDDNKTLLPTFARQAAKAGETRPEHQMWLAEPNSAGDNGNHY